MQILLKMRFWRYFVNITVVLLLVMLLSTLSELFCHFLEREDYNVIRTYYTGACNKTNLTN